MLRAARLLHIIEPDRSVNSGNDCELAATFTVSVGERIPSSWPGCWVRAW
jgi:hypothetical protein